MKIVMTRRALPRKRAARAAVCVLAAVLAGGVLLFGVNGREAPVSAALTSLPKKRAAKTEEQRQAFLAALGWEVSEKPVSAEEVTIPKRFDSVYAAYNELQQTQGLDLRRCRGKTCTRYTYDVKNYPENAEGVQLNLLVCRGKIVGGDVCGLSLGGFQRNLLYPTDSGSDFPSADVLREAA